MPKVVSHAIRHLYRIVGVGAWLMQLEAHMQPIADDRRFEQWLSRRLHAAHDAILQENVPAELMQLVQLFAVDLPHGTRLQGEAGESSTWE